MRGFLRSVLTILALCATAPGFAAVVPPDGDGAIADIVAKVTPSVVRVIVVQPPQKPAAGTQQAAKGTAASGTVDLTPDVHIGSGFSIGPGLIATNRHVVEGAVSIYVRTSDGARYKAEVAGTTSKADIALIKIDPASNIPALPWGDSDTVRPGDIVIAIGSPFGFDNTVTAGVVSSVNRDIMESPFDDYIQIDAAINHGNSGGPLFNMKGEVIGMNSVLYSPTTGFAGLAFALPSNDLQFALGRLRDYGTVLAGMLPIRAQEVSGLMAQALNIPHAGGALVASLELGSNLMAGAIQPGDVISAVDGKPVLDPRDLARKAVRVPVGSNVRLTLWRGGKEMTVSVPILPLEGAVRTGSADAGRKPVLGLRFTSVTGSARAARLDFVDPIGTAADSGLMKGDLILQVRQTPVWTSDQVTKALQDRIDQKEPFTALLVQRDGKTWWVPVALPN